MALAALSIAAAAGCWSSSAAGPGPSRAAAPAVGASALPAPPRPASPLHGAAANLTSGDLRGYRSGPPGRGIWSAVEAGQAARCLGYAGIRPVRQLRSATFSPATDLVARQVASEVVVFASASQASRVERALAGEAGAQCLQGPLRQALEPYAAAGSLSLSRSVETTPLAVSASGAGDSFAYRVAMTAVASEARGHSFSLYDDLMGFRLDQDLVELNTYSAGQLIPVSTEEAWLDGLYRRAGRS